MPHHLPEARGGNLQLIPPPLPPFQKKIAAAPEVQKGGVYLRGLKARVWSALMTLIKPFLTEEEAEVLKN